jgi:hypothetical protein
VDRSEQSREQQSSEFLSDLINGGFVDTTLAPFDARASRLKYFEWFQKIRQVKRHWGNQETYELWPAPQSQRWQESHLEAHTCVPETDHWAVEVARFAVPDGQIGFVKRIEQVVTDVSGSYYPTNVSHWGSPHFVLTDVDNLRWYLTISFYDGLLPARHIQQSAVAIPAHALPGQPYTDLFEIDGLWYPAHNNKPLKLIIPGGRLLRFFLITPPTTVYQWIVEGKLSGYTQSTYQLGAMKNAREFD